MEISLIMICIKMSRLPLVARHDSVGSPLVARHDSVRRLISHLHFSELCWLWLGFGWSRRVMVCLVCWFFGRVSTVLFCKWQWIRRLEPEGVFTLLIFWESKHAIGDYVCCC